MDGKIKAVLRTLAVAAAEHLERSESEGSCGRVFTKRLREDKTQKWIDDTNSCKVEVGTIILSSVRIYNSQYNKRLINDIKLHILIRCFILDVRSHAGTPRTSATDGERSGC